MISEFSFLRTGLKIKTQKSREIFVFLGFFPKLYQMGIVCLFLCFGVVDNGITLFNCFFRDFSGFCDFRFFDLVTVDPHFFQILHNERSQEMYRY